MKNKILIGIVLLAGIVLGGTVVQIPQHLQDIKFARCLISADGNGGAKVIAYFNNSLGKMAPVAISEAVISGYGKILALFIQQIMDSELASQGYTIVGSTVDWDTTGVTMTEAYETNTVDEMEVVTKIITIRQVL